MNMNSLTQPINLLIFVNVYNELSKKFLPMMHSMPSHSLQLSPLREIILHKIHDNKNGGIGFQSIASNGWHIFYFEDSFLISIFGTKM